MVRYTSIKNQIKRYIYNIGLIFEENVQEILNENNLLSNYRCITVSALPTPSLSLWCPCWYCTTGRKNGENIKFRVSVKILKPRKINSSTYAAHPCVTSRLHHICWKYPDFLKISQCTDLLFCSGNFCNYLLWWDELNCFIFRFRLWICITKNIKLKRIMMDQCWRGCGDFLTANLQIFLWC